MHFIHTYDVVLNTYIAQDSKQSMVLVHLAECGPTIMAVFVMNIYIIFMVANTSIKRAIREQVQPNCDPWLQYFTYGTGVGIQWCQRLRGFMLIA